MRSESGISTVYRANTVFGSSWLTLPASKFAEYRRNTAYLLVGEGMDGMFIIAPADFALLSVRKPVKLEDVFRHAREWLNL